MMRRLMPIVLLFCGLLPVAALAGSAADSTARGHAGGPPARLKSVTLHIFSRIFENFHDKVVALPGKEFRVGDSEYTAKVLRFEPDFTLDIQSHKVTSRSGEPHNPAFQIEVRRKGAAHDTCWAFFNMPPHFTMKNQLAFVATEIQFTNRPPMVSNDSLAIKIRKVEGGAH